jgi:ABC-type multidrug transport system permease subunit
MDTVSLFVPQGWGVHALRAVLRGGSVSDVLPYVAVMLGLAVIFFVIGLLRFRKRFAQSL